MDIKTNNSINASPKPAPAPVDTPPEPTPPTDRPATPQRFSAELPKKRKFPKWVLLVLALLLVIGGGAYWYLTRDNKKAADQTENAKQDIDILKIGILENPTGLYPASKIANTDWQVNGQVFEGLVGYEGRSKLTPLLAESWTNPDESTWVFTLKPGVKFQSGRMLTAEDVKASIEYIQANNESLSGVLTSTITAVEAVDEGKVKITTDGSDPTLLNKLAFLYIFDTKVEDLQKNPSGTGPYQLKPGVDFDTAKIQLVAFDDYHAGHVYTRELLIETVDTEANAVAALKEGKYNIIGDLSNESLELAGSGVMRFNAEDSGVYFLMPNSVKKNSPVQKLAVRQALNHALNISAVMEAHNLTGKVASQMITQDIPGYNPKVEHLPNDVTKAKELLKDAGYANGTTLTLAYSEQVQPAVDEMQKQLAEAGITLKLDKQADLDGVFSAIETSDMVFLNYSSDILDSLDVFQAVFQGLGMYEDTTLDGLVEEATMAKSAAERLEKLQAASARVADQAAAVPMYSRSRLWLQDKDYGLVQDHPSAILGVFFWKVYQ